MNTQTEAPIDRAIRLAGGMSAMARTLELSGHQVIYQWKQNQVPAEHCPNIEENWGVKCEELRPDVNWSVLRKEPSVQVPVTQISEV
jgi:DNA-binding transcriptional regulator YdaS (Cro superfamily)